MSFSNTESTDTHAVGTKRHGSIIQPHIDEVRIENPSTPTLVEFSELVHGWRFERLEQLAREGRRVIWGGGGWNSPLIRATGTISVGINELWRKDSKLSEQIAEKDYLIPPELCSMIKTMIGRWHLKKDDPIQRILDFSSGCEPIQMVLEHARKEGFDVHTIEGATAFKLGERRDNTVAFLVNELRKAAVWLQGKPVDEDRVAEEIHYKNEALRKVGHILDLRLKRPFDIGTIPMMWLLGGAGSYFGDRERFFRIIDKLAVELEAAAKVPETRSYVPIILAGGAPGGVSFIKLLEQANAVVVGSVMLGTSLYREDVPPLESIAHYLFDSQLRGEGGEGTGASATLRRRRIEDLIAKTGAKGLISAAITACPYASLVQQLERNHFRKIGFPIVALEHSVHNEPTTEEQTMRVKAFFEQLSEAA